MAEWLNINTFTKNPFMTCIPGIHAYSLVLIASSGVQEIPTSRGRPLAEALITVRIFLQAVKIWGLRGVTENQIATGSEYTPRRRHSTPTIILRIWLNYERKYIPLLHVCAALWNPVGADKKGVCFRGESALT